MIHRAAATVLFASLSFCAAPLPAQQENADELSVTKLPLADELPAVRFVAFARERGPQKQRDWSDMRITLWEIDPMRENQPVVRRKVLGHSHWNVRPLLDSPEVLRWQVKRKRRPYEVKLLRVDYAKFEVEELLHIGQAQAFGASGDIAFLNTSEGQCLFDMKTGKRRVRKPEIRLLRQLDADWLVVVDGKLARFDAQANKIVRRYDDIAVDPNMRTRVDWDGGRFAVSFGGFVDTDGNRVVALEFGVASIVYRELRIWNLQKGEERKLRVRVQARGGSGVGVIPEVQYGVLDGPLFRYTERVPLDPQGDIEAFEWERDTQWVTIEIATGKEMLREPSTKHKTPKHPFGAKEIAVPDYLREGFAQSPIRAWGPEQDLAYAFLQHKGVAPELPEKGVQKLGAVCRSPDGDQMLVMHGSRFYHCDLKAETVKTLRVPAALALANVELHAVRLDD